MNRMETVKLAYLTFDDVQGRGFAHNNICTSCTVGCFACCAEPLQVSKAEAQYIVKHIPEAERDGVIERTRAWVETVKDSELLKQTAPFAWEWIGLKAMCPLMKDGKCLVYEARPIGCRNHNAVGDPELCGTPEGRKQQKYVGIEEAPLQAATWLVTVEREYDHLGAYLSLFLLNEPLETGGHGKMPFRFKGFEGPQHALTVKLERTDQ